MPREKNAKDWILTWSPPEDCQEIPEEIERVLDSDAVTRHYTIAERHGNSGEKWHIHAGFTTVRTFNSDYKWWQTHFKSVGLEEPALDIKYHNNIFGLVGGYCTKSENTKFVKSRGFTQEQLDYGKDIYDRRQRRQRIRKFCDDYIPIPKSKFEVAIGAMQAEMDCNKDEAIKFMADDGFAFAESYRGLEWIYRNNYNEMSKMQDKT